MTTGASADAAAAHAASSTRRGLWVGLDQAWGMSTELLAAILTWTGIGWLVDRWLGTSPWFVAFGALLGNACGLYLVWLRGKQMDEAERRAREGAAPGGAHEPATPVAEVVGDR